MKITQNNYQILYIIQMENTQYYKVGRTKNLNARWYQLQCGNPIPLKVVVQWCHTQKKVVKKYELNFHRILTKQGQRVRDNGEWFTLTDKQVKELAEVAGNIKKQNKLFEKILKNQKF